LPAPLQQAYAAMPASDIFAVRDSGGHLIAAMPETFGPLVAHWPTPTDDPSYFHLAGIESDAEDYYGLSITLGSAAGPVSIWVARAAGATAFVHSLLAEFVFDVAWVIPLFMLLVLAVAVLAIRGAMKPVREVSDIAAAIGPAATSVRLPSAHLPGEIVPLVTAVNRALERLEQGFAVQRQFTANAAHELRTPLAIVTGALDAMESSDEVARLRADVARMNRLVEQLLSVARLDSVALDVSQAVDLNEIAKEVVATLAPWALAQGRTLAFADAACSVVITGNGHAIADALRNLVENAVTHGPLGSEVTVATSAEGSLSVSDHGRGVAEADRERIFDRFWRGKCAAVHGAGLGLAIVAEIMKAHGGRVSVSPGPDGGAIFTLAFRPHVPRAAGCG
ncbi:MAG TPA: HAMP domain-containing sensor histidine kinase, partial [Vineibacter sp.]|nr:HAMP domain-containing sensor histidine kinase [Vineibacter sp.]